MSGHDAGPLRTASSAASLTSGSTPRMCTAMLAGLVSSRIAGMLARDRLQLGEQPAVELVELGREPLDEPEVELGAVAADQVHLARQAGERRQVAQRAPGDHRDHGLRQRRQRTDGSDRLRQRAGGRRIVDERRERAVVVAADEQLRDARNPAECGAQLGVEPAVRHDVSLRAPRRSSPNRAVVAPLLSMTVTPSTISMPR